MSNPRRVLLHPYIEGMPIVQMSKQEMTDAAKGNEVRGLKLKFRVKVIGTNMVDVESRLVRTTRTFIVTGSCAERFRDSVPKRRPRFRAMRDFSPYPIQDSMKVNQDSVM